MAEHHSNKVSPLQHRLRNASSGTRNVGIMRPGPGSRNEARTCFFSCFICSSQAYAITQRHPNPPSTPWHQGAATEENKTITQMATNACQWKGQPKQQLVANQSRSLKTRGKGCCQLRLHCPHQITSKMLQRNICPGGFTPWLERP